MKQETFYKLRVAMHRRLNEVKQARENDGEKMSYDHATLALICARVVSNLEKNGEIKVVKKRKTTRKD